MKGLNMRNRFAQIISAMIGDSNAKFSHGNTGTMGYKTSWNPGRFRSNSGSRKNSPGRKRKLGANAFMTPAPPNPERRFRKTLNGEIKHMSTPRGFMNPAPTMDNTAIIGQIMGCKIHVKGGKMFIRNTVIEIKDWVEILKEHSLGINTQLRFETEYQSL